MLRGDKLIEVSAKVVEEVRLPPKKHGYEPVIQMLEVVNDRGLGLDKQLLRFYYLKKTKEGRKFPPRTVGLWFEEGIIEDFRKAIKAENAQGISRLLGKFLAGKLR